MSNGTLALSIGKSSLQAHQRALETVSQNLANANTEGYARKVVNFKSNASINLPDVQGPVYFSQIGTGVSIGRIESVRDLVLNGRIRDLVGQESESEETKNILDRVEALFTGEIDIAKSTDDFFSAINDLAGAPDSLTVRSVVRARGEELTNLIRSASAGLEEIRSDLSAQVSDKVSKINTISQEFTRLNEEAGAMASAGMPTNDYEDRRQVLLEQLSEFGNVQTVSGPAESLTVLLGGQVIVQGLQSFDVTIRNDSSNSQLPQLAVGNGPNDVMTFTSGTLKAWSDLRDNVLPDIMGNLDELAITLSQSFNTIHRTGFGLDGTTGVNFFDLGSSETGETRPWSIRGSEFVPEIDKPLDGDSSTTQPENFELNPIGKGSFILNGRSITYDGATDSLEDIVARINSTGAGVYASITPENRLQLDAMRGKDYVIETMADSGGNFLERLGILDADKAYPPPSYVNPPTSIFSGTVTLRPKDSAASRIQISSVIKNNLNAIAAAKGDDLSAPPDGVGDVSRGPGDGGNAILLAALRESNTMEGGTGTYNDFVIGMLGEIGVEAGAAERSQTALDAQITQLKSRREEIQGVSIDEEMINMIKYQRGFEAAARIISTMDQVLQTLIALGR